MLSLAGNAIGNVESFAEVVQFSPPPAPPGLPPPFAPYDVTFTGQLRLLQPGAELIGLPTQNPNPPYAAFGAFVTFDSSVTIIPDGTPFAELTYSATTTIQVPEPGSLGLVCFAAVGLPVVAIRSRR